MLWLLLLFCAEGVESISDTEPFHLNPSWNDQEQAIAKRFNYFDLELLREVATDENVFVSPASIKATLAMVLEGANGVCAEEIVKTLRLPLNQNDSRNQLKPLLYDLNDKNRNSLLESANGMFVNSKLNILDSYRHTIESYYRGFVRPVNFTNIIQATNTINNWVSNVTRGFIQRIVGPENVNPSSSLLITNALFFKGTWKHAFDERQTKPKCFEPPTRECINVHMMSNTADLNYRLIDDVDAHALELPYSDEKYAMLILLPRIKNNIHALMRDLQHASFNSIMDKLERTEVMYELPRFDIDFSMDLVKPLQQLGIREIFGDRANLTGIVANQQIFVDSVVHKTKIEVNERGTTAAAVTGAVVIPLMGSSSPKVIADHPFAFFIYRKDNRNILFEGIVNRPVEAALESRSNFNYVPNNKFNGRGARRLTNYGT